eukprot:CAMPEP_0116999586 /NCGR_PEP_ID=MMETSP0472-20121206/2239_1 /TAXON_ID=693140 ORGANISM="Tiarina fusus, Strain LIS" /NCGR_SAMPLE_ID=MMETSP0472 /ASSEMBLY_ACC=CAM_ASM_000603 /LENGTH=539 /DNA_ID=CAMNT_0004699049 /DNA_START=102 /DNA_END=1718 /DNA_ORIENTATION=+
MVSEVHKHVIQDLLEALHDDEMTDISLIGHDGVSIPAKKFVLAARSKVLKRMLYGSFREATATEIPFHEYDGVILEAIVEYCCRNEIPKFRLYINRSEESARRLVQLFKAADYLELTELAKMVAQMAHNLTSRFPPLACAVYDEADLYTKVSADSLMMIQCRPYVTLPPHCESGGGITCLSESKLLLIYQNKDIKAGELFLFEMLEQWKELSEHPEAARVVKECAKDLILDNIEPHHLLGTVTESGFCSERRITEAITKQALRASQDRIWSLPSRGRPEVERILVEGAGSKNTNGIYYRIGGLSNGDLYSKQEVACGQQYVYTLSISENKDEVVECRIFCSKLLTHCAVKTFVRTVTRDPSFQPILQVVHLAWENADGGEIDSILGVKNRSSKSNNTTRLLLSDGEHYITATLGSQLRSSNRIKELVPNTLIKVFGFERDSSEGRVSIKLKKLSIISQDPGHRFGNPAYFYDVCDDQEKEDEQAIVTTDAPVETQICQALLRDRNATATDETQTLLELYSCQYPINEKPIDSKIPNTGW